MENNTSPRDKRIPILVSADEKQKLQDAAKAVGLSVSTFTRMKMLEIVRAQ